MRKVKITKEREVFDFCKPYIIAEIGSNHNGDMELARKLILEAKKNGADAVKFQSFSKNSIMSKLNFENNFFLGDDYRNRTDFTLEEIVEKFSVSEKELRELHDFCKEIKIDFASTPFSFHEVDFLVDVLDVPFVKIASMDVNNYPFLEYVAKKGKPIILSTGLSELSEIDLAIKTIEEAGNKELIILHCISIYPPKAEDINLNRIDTLRRLYDYPIGFSDHSIGTTIPLASVVKGACIIEKHFTVDKDMFGWDHKISMTPEELNFIAKESEFLSRSLGDGRIYAVEDKVRRQEFRRSLIINKDKKKGDVIKLEDIQLKRPGVGIPPGEMYKIAGRTLNKNITEDSVIYWEDLV